MKNIPQVLKFLINLISVEQKTAQRKKLIHQYIDNGPFCAKLTFFGSLELTQNDYQEKLTQRNED